MKKKSTIDKMVLLMIGDDGYQYEVSLIEFIKHNEGLTKEESDTLKNLEIGKSMFTGYGQGIAEIKRTK